MDFEENFWIESLIGEMVFLVKVVQLLFKVMVFLIVVIMGGVFVFVILESLRVKESLFVFGMY